MPQQTKTEALEELARLIRRDIMNGTARLNETWWFDDDTKMQDRIAHVLLDYSDEEKPEEIDKVCYNSRLDVFCGQIDELTEKCAALVVERDQLHRQMVSLVEDPAQITTPFGPLPINSAGMRRLLDEIVTLRDERDHIKAQFAEAFGEQRERAFDKMAKPLVEEQGPWCCVRDSKGWTPTLSTPDDSPIYSCTVEGAEKFDTLEAAKARCVTLNAEQTGMWRPVTATQAAAIVGGGQ